MYPERSGRTLYLGIAAVLALASACFAQPQTAEHADVFTGSVKIWTANSDIYVYVVDDQDPTEHLFVLQRSVPPFDATASYARARVTFRAKSLKVVAEEPDETWLFRLVPRDMLTTPPRGPGKNEPGVVVGYGLSHHEQPLDTDATALELRATHGAFFNQTDSPGVDGDCSSGGEGASACSISCGTGRSCSVTCTLGYACCLCDEDDEPSCKCRS